MLLNSFTTWLGCASRRTYLSPLLVHAQHVAAQLEAGQHGVSLLHSQGLSTRMGRSKGEIGDGSLASGIPAAIHKKQVSAYRHSDQRPKKHDAPVRDPVLLQPT